MPFNSVLLHTAMAAEVWSTIICIHCIYGKKIRLDVRTMLVFLGILSVSEVIYHLRISNGYTMVSQLLFFIYCICEFRESVWRTVIKVVLFNLLFVAIQFMCMIIVSFFISRNEVVRTFMGNMVVLGFCGLILPRCRADRLGRISSKKKGFHLFSIAFAAMIIFAMLYVGKVEGEIPVEYFILVIPVVVFLLVFIAKWDSAQDEAKCMEQEVEMVHNMQAQYDSMLTSVRMKQHELKNHIAAMFSAHYTYKTYEQLVKAQEEYCHLLLQDHKYNDLLLMGDNILAAFLYGKMREAESDGIHVDFMIKTHVGRYAVLEYHLVEMLGVLFDNAVESQKGLEKKSICIRVTEEGARYQFAVLNPFRHVGQDEVLDWFRLDKSSKGAGRGIGLYHVKQLCDENGCEISCENVERHQENWIKFTLWVDKRDS